MLILLVVVIFSIYTVIESLALITRGAGTRVDKAILGMSLQNTLLAINRFGGFLIAPLLGLMADYGLTEKDIYIAAMISYILAAILLSIAYFSWNSIMETITAYIIEMNNIGYHKKFKIIISKSIDKKNIKLNKINFFIASLITTALASSSVFIMNILGFIYPEFKSTLLQSGTLISGFGNLILNFYTYPILAILENKLEAEGSYESIYLGKIIGLALLCPLITTLIYFYG